MAQQAPSPSAHNDILFEMKGSDLTRAESYITQPMETPSSCENFDIGRSLR